MYRYTDFKDARFKDGDCAQIIIRRRHLGSANNDCGFFVDQSGESVTLLCDFSRKATKFNDAWITKVRMEYDCEILAKKAKALGKPFQRIEKGGKVFAAIGA